MHTRNTILGAVAGMLMAALALATTATAQVPTIFQPDTTGDQAIFYYDARADFTTFLQVRNGGVTDLRVRVLFYGPTFSTPLTNESTIPAGGSRVIDVGGLAGLPEQAGAAFAFAVNDAGEAVVSGAISGGFTVANLQTNSAWGSWAPARSARNADSGSSPPLGTVINGTTVQLTPIQPIRLDIPGYYNPTTLAPVALGGNQIIFVNFEDTAGANFAAVVSATDWNVNAVRADGSGVGATTFAAGGVTVSDLASVAGSGVNGSSGSVEFRADSTGARLSRLIFFSESLGTFGTGYLLPSVPPL